MRTGSVVLGRCYVNVRVCACPGRDSKQEIEAINRPGKRKKPKASELVNISNLNFRVKFMASVKVDLRSTCTFGAWS